MKTYVPTVRRLRFVHLTLTVLMNLIVFAPRATVAELQRPTAHELAAIAAANGERLWYHEEEFHRDPALRARPHQVVVLHLEPGGGGGKSLRNTIPYLFEETADYSFCVPKEDPHIRSLELVREGSRGVAVHVPRGAPCKTRTIAAGLYQLVVEHDGEGVAAAGKKAFVHVPRFKRNLQAGGELGSFPSSCSDPINTPLFSFTAPNGQFVSGDSNNKAHTEPTFAGFLGWNICPDSSGNYTFHLPAFFQTPAKYLFSSGPPSTDTSISLNSSASTSFKVTDLGNGQFTLAANFSGKLYPIVVGADGTLNWAQPGTTATVFTTVLKYYFEGAFVPALQTGEVAVFPGCNYDSSSGTWIFVADIPNLQAFVDFEFSGPASVALSPGTPVALYAGMNYSGTALFLKEDIPCLGDTSVGYATQSLKLTPTRELVAATDECQNCNLSGLDLSNLDLSGGQFQGSTFTGVNLTNTSLQAASLDNANLNGAATVLTNTSFVSAILHCTNLSGADLSQATVLFSGIRPIVTTDFSCRVDLTDATFNLNSFPLTQWRYFNLTGAKINGITGATLSTTASPLDLSGAILNQAVLLQVQLDSANLGCATTTSGAPVCTQLTDTNLNKASLRRVTLEHALLQGADLNSTNLDGASLCAAKLNQSTSSNVSATLQGAFLRNVNLAQADLTGANLSNANFYSTTAVSTCNSAAACGFLTSCASAVNATLNNAVFSGAYLAGVDFSGSKPQSVDFSGAFLAGSHFTNANLSQDLGTGKRTDFTGAALQGTTFTNANATGASFTGAVVDLTHSNGQTLLAQLSPATHLTFPSYTPSGTPGCVSFTYKSATGVPATTNSNLCPDGNFGPCTTAQWQAVLPPAPPSCTLDFNWLFVTYPN